MENQPLTKEKILDEISELKTRIKNTEYDLAHMFKGNAFLEEKLNIAKTNLESKQKLLQELESQPEEKAAEVQNMKEEISEKESISISEDQEQEIESEMETVIESGSEVKISMKEEIQDED